MEGLELDIFFHTKQTRVKHNNDLDYLLSECDIRVMTFINIDTFSPYFDDDGSEYSQITSGGLSWHCMLTYDELKEKVDQWTLKNTLK